ncbi:MAG: accessory gene regulator B family protein, partial [Clostridia bacterium]|nr:accessory gene regulator B family protein [Clostridia bacterium]
MQSNKARGEEMIDKICMFLTNKIRKEMPDIDDEKAEVILYGIQLIVGEIPKILLMLVVAAIFRVFWQTLLSFFLILPYKAVSGGFHLKTHIGCFVGTIIVYCGNAILSMLYSFPSNTIKYTVIAGIFIFSIIMISLYAPADTENLPILTKKERKIKRILS